MYLDGKTTQPDFSDQAKDWRKDAACREYNPELFFPVGATGPALEHIEAAKAICSTCLVRRECLTFALETNQEAGVWGGTSEEERQKLRRAWVRGRRPRNDLSEYAATEG